MRHVQLVLLAVTPAVLGYLVIFGGGPCGPGPGGRIWHMSPFIWGVVFLAAWFFIGRKLGKVETPVTGMLVGVLPTVILGAVYVQQMYLTEEAARSSTIPLTIAQAYSAVVIVVATRTVGLFTSSIHSVPVTLVAYGMMILCFTAGFVLAYTDRRGRTTAA